FVLRGVDDLPIDGKAFLPGEASRLALTGDQSRVEEELRDRSRTSRNLDGRRSRGHESAGLASILARRRVGMKLTDEPLREPLLDVAWILTLPERALFGSELVRWNVGGQLEVARDELVGHAHRLAVDHR